MLRRCQIRECIMNVLSVALLPLCKFFFWASGMCLGTGRLSKCSVTVDYFLFCYGHVGPFSSCHQFPFRRNSSLEGREWRVFNRSQFFWMIVTLIMSSPMRAINKRIRTWHWRSIPYQSCAFRGIYGERTSRGVVVKCHRSLSACCSFAVADCCSRLFAASVACLPCAVPPSLSVEEWQRGTNEISVQQTVKCTLYTVRTLYGGSQILCGEGRIYRWRETINAEADQSFFSRSSIKLSVPFN